MAVCPNCGYRLEEGMRVCSGCGEAIELLDERFAEVFDMVFFAGLIKAVEGREGKTFWFIFFGADGLVFLKRSLSEARLLIGDTTPVVASKDDVFKQPQEIQMLLKNSPEEVLSRNSENLFLEYNEIERVELKKIEFLNGPLFLTGRFSLVTNREIRDFFIPASALDGAYQLFSRFFGSRVERA